jgi:hypothetical protein
MNQGKPNKFFKAYINNTNYKVFLDDVSFICKVALKKTPALQPYYESSKQINDDTD